MEDAKKLLKKFAKKVLKKVITSKVALIFLPLLIILVILLSLFIYGITLDEGTYKEDDWSNTPFAASSYINAIDISEKGLVLEYSAQELWDKMLENGSNIKNYLNSPEELEKLMNVEIVTQYPKIGKGNIDGIVEFKRVDTNSNIKDLKYVDEETFNSYIEKYNSSGDETASNYFTIDSSGNLLMSQWTKITTKVTTTQGVDSTTTTTVGYSMTATNINYKAVLQKYTMPFNYLWALLISTGGHDFVLDLADYVLEDSEIEITGTENYTTSTDTQVETTEIEVQVTVEKEDPKTGEKIKETKTETQTKTTTTETTVETNNVAVELTKANTWIVDYEKDSNGKEKTTIKDDPKSTEQNFITILNKYPSTKKNMVAYAQWIFELLGKNTDTANMVDLTKYLLYKATGKDFGVTEYDFSEYENNLFYSTGSSGDSIPLYTPILDKETFVKALKEYANNGAPSAFKTNFLPYAGDIYDWSVAAGVNPELVIITANAEQSFSAPSNAPNNYWGIAVYTQSSVGKGYASLHDGIIAYANVIKSYNVGGSHESDIMRLYNRRKDSGCNPLGYGLPGTLSGMQSLYSATDNTTHARGKSEYGNYLLNCVYRGSQSDYQRLCVNGGLQHADSAVFTPWESGEYTAWQVEQKLKMWNKIFGKYGTISSGGNETIIETAKSKLGCPYVIGAKGPNSFDCSGFVWWVYKQNGINVPGSTDSYKSYIGGAKEISWEEAQPGDILIVTNTERGTEFGHAAIYLGDDSYIHAPQTGDVVKIAKSGAKTKFKHVFRFY